VNPPRTRGIPALAEGWRNRGLVILGILALLAAVSACSRLRSLQATPTPTTAPVAAAPASPTTAPTIAPTIAPATPTPAVPTPAATLAPSPTDTSVPATDTSVPSPTASPTTQIALSAANRAAIQSVIQKANAEQAQAFAKQDATLMRDTATSSYYQQLVQTNQQLAGSGVTSIQLIKLEWGPIAMTGPATAQATTFETWRTFFNDGTTDQSRDRNIYTLVELQGAWKIQDDAHPDAQGTPPGSNTPGPSTIPPPATPGSRGQSHNWSGYAAEGGSYTAVTGTWTIPQPTGTQSASGATWVGIGGVRARDLIQAGTEEIVAGPGDVLYSAWIELLPHASRTVPLNVSPGDSVTVSITRQSGDQWQVSLRDNTTGKSFQTAETYASSLSSAEWVEEAPSGGRRVLPLENFGTVSFSNGITVKDGQKDSIAQAGAQPISMIDRSGQVIAVPSKLTSNGSGFSVQRTSAGLSSPAGATPTSPGLQPGTPAV
jgi:hypothetical protein